MESIQKYDADRQRWLLAMAEHVLAEGLRDASLRPLARAAGTSDRMLIYHFGSKAGVIEALLVLLAERMTAELDALLPAGRAASETQVVSEVRQLLLSPQGQGYQRLWFDILSVAAQSAGTYRTAGQQIAALFLRWLDRRLPEPARGPAILTLLEGILVMDVLEMNTNADAALVLLDPLRAPS